MRPSVKWPPSLVRANAFPSFFHIPLRAVFKAACVPVEKAPSLHLTALLNRSPEIAL